MTNINILTTSHSTFDTRIFHKEARSLADAGHNVTLITPHDSDTEREGIKIKSVGNGDVESAGLGHAREIYAEAKQSDADVYHFHDIGLLPFGVLLSYRTESKVVYDCHEDYGNALQHYGFLPEYFNPLVNRLFPSFQSFLAKRLDAVVAATDWIAEDFVNRGHDNVTLIRNFPRKSILENNKATVETNHEYTLVYVGGLSETRGLFRMLELTNELRNRGKDAGLWLIGTITENTEDNIEEFTRESNLQGHIRSFGYVEPDNLSGYLKAADVGMCLLSQDRAEYIIPTKMFEYMFSKLPVVATRTTATERYLPENCGVLVSENKENQIKAVEELLSDDELRAEMGRNGKKKIETEYCWEIEQKSLLSLYKNL